MLFVQPGFRGSNDLRVGRKMATFQFFFQSREQGQSQSRRIAWVIKTLEAQVGQFLLGGKCPVSWGIVSTPSSLNFYRQDFSLESETEINSLMINSLHISVLWVLLLRD